MSNGRVSIELTESTRTIEQNMYAALSSELNKHIDKNKGRVSERFKQAIKIWVLSSPEIVSLLSSAPGQLGAHFGLRAGNAEIVVNTIADSVASDFSISFNKINNNMRGGISFNFQRQEVLNLLSLRSGHVMTEKGADLHWLDWLLTKGDTIIVTGYEYEPSSMGRSGGGTMKIGRLWRVPPVFSGTNDNNFLTRLFAGKETEVSSILKGLFA